MLKDFSEKIPQYIFNTNKEIPKILTIIESRKHYRV